MTQASAGAPQIVGRDAVETAFRASGFDHAPDDLGTETVGCNPTRLVDCKKGWPGADTGGGQPVIHCRFDPGWDGYGSHVATLPNEVCDYPMLLSLLEMFHGERGQFRSPEAASQEDSDHGVVTLATKIPIVEDGKKSFPLFSGQPVSNPHAVLLDVFNDGDFRGKR